jgi:hypothetical protein
VAEQIEAIAPNDTTLQALWPRIARLALIETEPTGVRVFEALGTAAADKRHLIYEGGHDVPRTELIKETLGWFDKYLGPVR